MKSKVDLYDSHYENVEAAVYRDIRAEVFGEDMGQTSWITAKECEDFCRWLGLEQGRRVLEVACGSGGVATRIAERIGAVVVGVDINEAAVQSAKARAKARGVSDRTEFHVADASEPLPFPDGSFHAVFCNDSINHLRNRKAILTEWKRLVHPGGRCLYTDPIVVTGFLSNEEIEKRSSIGYFVFTPQGANEAAIRSAGLRLIMREDVTDSVERTSVRWREARAARRKDLCRLEGESKFEGLQEFLSIVHTLSSERRLSRYAYMGEKPARAG